MPLASAFFPGWGYDPFTLYSDKVLFGCVQEGGLEVDHGKTEMEIEFQLFSKWLCDLGKPSTFSGPLVLTCKARRVS